VEDKGRRPDLLQDVLPMCGEAQEERSLHAIGPMFIRNLLGELRRKTCWKDES